jgi:hypothetical protein
MPAREGVSAGLVGTKFANNSIEHSQGHYLRDVPRIPVCDSAVHPDTGKATFSGPFNGDIRFGKMPRTGGHDQWVEVLDGPQFQADPRSFKAKVVVRKIDHRFDTGFGNNPGQFAAAPAKQWAKQLAV